MSKHKQMTIQEMIQAITSQSTSMLAGGWVEIEYTNGNGMCGQKNGIYHCPVIDYNSKNDEPCFGWDCELIISFGMGFNQDGKRPFDKTRILRHLEYNEIGILSGYRPELFYYKGDNVPSAILIIKQ